MAKLYGREAPRLWTRPLRPLTPETSLGFEVIEFALFVLGVDLYPWQKWLLIHALELREDGTYRFRRVIVLVGRQNGKTTLASVLAAWWLYVDSARNPDRIPPFKFKVVGVAQNLDIAKEPWSAVKLVRPGPGDGGGGGARHRGARAGDGQGARRERVDRYHCPVAGALRDPRGEERSCEARRQGPHGRDARAARLVCVERGVADDEVLLERDARRLLERGRRGLGGVVASAQRGAP